MAAIKVVISGATGKMGVETVAAVSRETDLELVGGTCKQDRGTTLVTPTGDVHLSTDLESALEKTRPDVMVDFTNAAVALEVPAEELVKDVDDVSFCLSKGLSCPVGSVLCGSRDFIEQARKWRKMVGGGMRQAGVLAAAGLVAMDTMIDRLADDHSTARRLASGLANIDGLSVDPDSIQTNIVIFEVDPSVATVQELIGGLDREGVKAGSPGPQLIRMVTHRQIGSDDVDDALVLVSKVVKQLK